MTDESSDLNNLLPRLTRGESGRVGDGFPPIDRTCPACGKRYVEQAKFCDYCGVKRESAAVVPAAPGAGIEKPEGSPERSLRAGGSTANVTFESPSSLAAAGEASLTKPTDPTKGQMAQAAKANAVAGEAQAKCEADTPARILKER